ncbi:MAG: DNA polymerase IV [Spirulina sp. SIO3F2]|nr:DNA polymerase IV [Spirulina sp. SIO3F2]
MDRTRRILHIDMDAFFASIEQRDQPLYRDRPLVVGGDPSQRGVVAAASYEARPYGIHSALSMRQAVQRCPELVVVRPRFPIYRAVSQQIQAIFRDVTPLVEPLALDEAYLDVSAIAPNLNAAKAIAQTIKQRIAEQTQLAASAGVSVNKFLAKLASKRHKPNGLCVIAPEAVPDLVAGLPIEAFPGIGPATTAKLHRLGIRTGAELRDRSEAELVGRFGKQGQRYYQLARGEDQRRVNPERIRKSVGAETTFAKDLTDLEAMGAALMPLAEQVERRLRACDRVGRTLTLKVKYGNFQQITRCCTRAQGWRSAGAMGEQGRRLLVEHVEPRVGVRLLGLSISNLFALEVEVKRAASSSSSSRYVQLSLSLD